MTLAIDALISPEWLAQNKALHDGPEGFGGSGYKQAQDVADFFEELRVLGGIMRKPKEILDYGCGEGTLKTELQDKFEIKVPIYEYDPAIPAKSTFPNRAGLVVCTRIGELRWRALGLDLDGKHPPADEQGGPG